MPEPRPDGALPRRRRRRSRRRRRRRGRQRARAASRAQGLAGRRAREGAVLGSRPRLGQRREGLRAASTGPRSASSPATNPIQMGKNNSGVGVGGSMTHFAGYVPRLHPVRLRGAHARRRRRRLADLLLGPEGVVRAGRARAAGRRASTGPGATRTATRTARTRSRAPRRSPGEGARELRHRDEGRARSRSRTACFGNRPHCIYRGFCLEGCKVNAKASPLITHVPDAIEHGCEVRADCMVDADRARRRERPRRPASPTSREGRERFQRAAAVAVCGYAIETPRLLLNSACPGHPHGLGNNADQVGRYVMVQGATQMAARFPELLRMYKAPPPEVSSEQFYETDERRGFARGFSIQTVSPLPIGWAEHVLAEGHWGQALREYMRDYNHWTVLGILARVPAAAREPRHPRRRRPTRTACRSRTSTTATARTTTRSSPTPRRSCSEIWDGAGAQETLTIDRHAHLVGGAAWASRRTTRSSTRTTASGGSTTSSSSTAQSCRPRAPRTRRSRSWRSPTAAATLLEDKAA